MEDESKEFNARATKAILSGLPNPIKATIEKYSSTKELWENLQDLHSKGH